MFRFWRKFFCAVMAGPTLALLLALILSIHALDVCAAHTGMSLLPSPQAMQQTAHENTVPCRARPGEACLCDACACVPLPVDSHRDGCEATCELAIAAHFKFQLAAPCFVTPLFASAHDSETAAPLLARAVYELPPRLRSQYFAFPQPGRAPPISA